MAIKTLTDNDRYKGKAYTITGPEILSYHQAAKILSEIAGKKIDAVEISEEKYRQEMKELGIDDWWINVIMEVYKLYKGGTLEHISSAVEEVTGRNPTTFAHFAKDYAGAFN